MKILFRIVVGIFAAIGIAYVAIVLVIKSGIWSEHRCTVYPVMTLLSPSGRYEARQNQEICTPDEKLETIVWIRDKEEDTKWSAFIAKSEVGNTTEGSYEPLNLRMKWVNDERLEISYPQGAQVLQHLPSTKVRRVLVTYSTFNRRDSAERNTVVANHLSSGSVSYEDSEAHGRFKEALIRANIRHRVYMGKNGREYIEWKAEHSDAVEQVQVSLFGMKPPQGRAIHFGGDLQDKFKVWLKSNGIPYTTTVHHGTEYVIWQEKDSSKIAQWDYFPRSFWKITKPTSGTSPNKDAQ